MQAVKGVVKVKKTHDDAVLPSFAHPGDSGFDFYAVEDKLVYAGDTVKVRTGLAFQLPPGMELQVRNRSGIASKTKLRVANSPGTIDNKFRGEVEVIIDNITRYSNMLSHVDISGHNVANGMIHDRGHYLIKKGDRIAQGVICWLPSVAFEEADELDETERGANGFGSSGIR